MARPEPGFSPWRLAADAPLLVPAAVTVVLAFHAAGFFASGLALTAVEILVVVVLVLLLGSRPLAGWTRALSLAAGSLALLAVWTALSATWSLSPQLALPDAVRVVSYGAILVLGALVAADDRSLRVMLGFVTLALVAICLIALASRTLPDLVWGISRRAPDRLAYPVGYSNGLGFVAAAALVLLTHFAAAARTAAPLRLAAIGTIPLAAATLVATASAGAGAAALAGFAIYALLAAPPALGRVVLAATVPSALAIWVVQAAPIAVTRDPDSSLSADAHRAAILLVLCAAAAAALYSVARRWDEAVVSRRVRSVLALAALLIVLPLVVAGAGAGIRVDYWHVAGDMALTQPLHGEGAGAFALVWPRERETRHDARDAHSLYLEAAGELGIVGLALLLVALGSCLRGMWLRARTAAGDRELHCVVLAAMVMWMLHAGIDWLWEQPGLGLWVFAAAGASLARAPAGEPIAARRSASIARIVAIAGCAVAAIFAGRLALAAADLEASARHARRGDCDAARARARQSLAVRQTSDAHLVIASCLVRTRPRAALTAVDRALALDPANWRVHYDRAVALASDGRDPRPEAGAAHALNLLEGNTLVALVRFGPDDPAVWRREAGRAVFSLP